MLSLGCDRQVGVVRDVAGGVNRLRGHVLEIRGQGHQYLDKLLRNLSCQQECQCAFLVALQKRAEWLVQFVLDIVLAFVPRHGFFKDPVCR